MGLFTYQLSHLDHLFTLKPISLPRFSPSVAAASITETPLEGNPTSGSFSFVKPIISTFSWVSLICFVIVLKQNPAVSQSLSGSLQPPHDRTTIFGQPKLWSSLFEKPIISALLGVSLHYFVTLSMYINQDLILVLGRSKFQSLFIVSFIMHHYEFLGSLQT